MKLFQEIACLSIVRFTIFCSPLMLEIKKKNDEIRKIICLALTDCFLQFL